MNSLLTPSKPNYQAAFNDCVRHLRKQKKKSFGPWPKNIFDRSKGCLYRAPDGSKCAVGGIMPDEIYNPDMETEGLYSNQLEPFMEYAGEKYGIDQPWFFQDLQHIHDDKEVSDWENQFEIFAREHNLTVPNL
jgi:hypothetical protein